MNHIARDAKRKRNFRDLRRAVENVANITNTYRALLVSFIEKIEVTTVKRDGLCYLTREQLARELKWSASKFDRLRRIAEGLGWIEVDRERHKKVAGGQRANAWAVDWERIQSDARKSLVFFGEPDEEALLQDEQPAVQDDDAPTHLEHPPIQDEHPYKEEFIQRILLPLGFRRMVRNA